MTTTAGMFSILQIEIDGHFQGSSDVPRPWVAAVLGTDPKWGLRREFLRPMTDWGHAKRAWSGNIYGRIARFMLRDGGLYEVCRLRGRSSRRHLAREFVAVEQRRRVAIAAAEALARVDGLGACATLQIPEDKTGASWVAHITGLGTPERLGFVVVGDERLYRLRDGLYEVVTGERTRFVGVRERACSTLTEREARAWLL